MPFSTAIGRLPSMSVVPRRAGPVSSADYGSASLGATLGFQCAPKDTVQTETLELYEIVQQGLDHVVAHRRREPGIHADEERPLGDAIGLRQLAMQAVRDGAIAGLAQDVACEKK